MQNWPADKIERRPIESLIPYARNARTHSDAQVAEIAESMKEWGWTNPILIDEDGMVIAGHGRVLAARKLGIDSVPVMVADGWTEAQKKAYALADNQLAMNAGWNDDFLKLELQELNEWGFDLSLIGFENLDQLLVETNDGLTDPDAVPDAPETPVTVLGDVWVLGRHRLVCGDSTAAGVVDACLNGVLPHLMVTDPPYGVEYDPKWRADAGVNNNKAKMGEVKNDTRCDWYEAWVLFPGDVAYVWHSGLHASEVQDSLIRAGMDIRSQIIWAKDRFAMSRGDYHWQHEPCWYAVRQKAVGHWAGDRKQNTVWNINSRDDSGHGHATQKPVECMRRPIVNNSSPGQAIYEPFSGSGTTIIAAEMEGRVCQAIEINPTYVDIAIKRWQNFTGMKAVREGDGMEYPDE